MFKVVNRGSPEIVKVAFRFCEENGYNLRHQNIFRGPIVNAVDDGTKQFHF